MCGRSMWKREKHLLAMLAWWLPGCWQDTRPSALSLHSKWTLSAWLFTDERAEGVSAFLGCCHPVQMFSLASLRSFLH